jgi:O-acetyl-ADP-ribose deacetylase (regulator of RNase III)
MEINYTKGDATNPIGNGTKIICHICNDIGAWGAGFVIAVSNRWPHVRQAYIEKYRSTGLHLGQTQFVQATQDIIVANMIGQTGIGNWNGNPPIRYNAVEQCLEQVAEYAQKRHCSVHMPRIGCGLGGSHWGKIGAIVERCLTKHGVAVTVYDL